MIIKRGKRITKKELLENGLYQIISGGVKPLGYINDFNRDKNTITIAQYGTAGYVDWQDKEFWANDVCYSLFPKDIIKSKYLYYYLINKQSEIYKLVNNAVPAHLPIEKLEEIKIYVPGLEIQNKIVSILDKFSDIISNLSIGLPAEINLRKKQYEYYRNKLLDFNKK